jgi:hypothetical protein
MDLVAQYSSKPTSTVIDLEETELDQAMYDATKQPLNLSMPPIGQVLSLSLFISSY